MHLNYLSKSIKNNLTKLIIKIDEDTIVGIILEKNGSFKKLRDILNTECLSPEIIIMLTSSKAYLKQIDYNNLTTEELDFILNSLQYTYTGELLRYKQNTKLKIEINNFNIKVAHSKETFEYNRELFPLLNEKQKITKNKIEFLKFQIDKLEALLNTKLSNQKIKKMINYNKLND